MPLPTSRPVIPALELIATVAQRVPGSDGTYILDTDTETLTTYIDYAAEQGMVVVLDLQRRTRHSRRGDRGKSATYWRDRTSIWRSIPSSRSLRVRSR